MAYFTYFKYYLSKLSKVRSVNVNLTTNKFIEGKKKKNLKNGWKL